MKNRLLHKRWLILLLVLWIPLSSSHLSAQAPRITYVYDDLGRLVRVITETGDAATYHYDAVGSILRIMRERGVAATASVLLKEASILRQNQALFNYTFYP